MNNGKLVGFRTDLTYSFDFLEKQLGDDFQEALDKGYFKKIAENKYIFTEKGREFAWKKEL